MLTIIQDTKEKIPWDFSIHKDVKQIKHAMKTGDYTVRGMEHLLCIERKRSTAEIAMNLGQKIKQFTAECDRMQGFAYRYIICEFPLFNILEFPKGSTIPRSRWRYMRINGKFLHKTLMGLSETYNIPVVFTNSSIEAQELALSIMREKWDLMNL